MLGNFSLFSGRLLISFSNQLFRTMLSGTLSKASNGLDPDQDRRFVGLDLGHNCLQRLSADGTSSCPYVCSSVCLSVTFLKFFNLEFMDDRVLKRLCLAWCMYVCPSHLRPYVT